MSEEPKRESKSQLRERLIKTERMYDALDASFKASQREVEQLRKHLKESQERRASIAETLAGMQRSQCNPMVCSVLQTAADELDASRAAVASLKEENRVLLATVAILATRLVDE